MTLVFYISGHGFGHASREIEVINAVHARVPDARVIVRTSAARWLFDRTLRGPADVQSAVCDTGAIQQGSLVVDVPATISTAAAFYEHLEPRIDEEAGLLDVVRAQLVLADMPPLAFAAAARAGVRAVGIGNFTWDWIYAAYTDALPVAPWLIDRLAGYYALADEAWRLPLAGGFESVRRIIDFPFVARHARHARDDVRERLGLPRDAPLLLVSFGGYQSHELDLASAAAGVRDARIVITATASTAPSAVPEGVLVIDENTLYGDGLRYEDLVGAVDIVLSKPGYGIVSECIANGTRLLYTSRGRFREYDVFVEQMPRMLPCEFLSHADLSAGRWNDAIRTLLARCTPPERPATNGADLIAERICRLARPTN